MSTFPAFTLQRRLVPMAPKSQNLSFRDNQEMTSKNEVSNSKLIFFFQVILK